MAQCQKKKSARVRAKGGQSEVTRGAETQATQPDAEEAGPTARCPWLSAPVHSRRAKRGFDQSNTRRQSALGQ
ncbi:unnamed protein product [Angiostrongylus costaricensis]|uniref:4F5 domain-containing protein n=1 Tax=Angiostrongylus costaricensis TaxID=334426 RepID=A0A0R3PCG2_ANGCS|nr:unnamed protein product [Angiostrongylus costaricensis]